MSKILVTGGAGFIGSHLVKALIQENHTVVVLDNLSTGVRSNIHPGAQFKSIDIRDYNHLVQAFNGVDYIYHLAALPRIQRSIHNPIETNEVNVQGTLNVLQAALYNKVKRVIFTSSSSIYGDQRRMPLEETTAPNPLSPYALQKWIGEQYCSLYASLYGLDSVILRLFSVYGSGQSGEQTYDTVIGRFLYLKTQGKPLTIFGDGKQSRDFTHIQDVVRALTKSISIEKIKNKTVNICAGRSATINQVAKLIGGKIVYKDNRIGESKHIIGSNLLAKRILKWTPTIKVEDGIVIK